MGTEVSIETGEVSRVTFVFSLPLLSNVRVQLHGENRFLVTSPHDSYLLKPSTIQSQWAALTFLTGHICTVVLLYHSNCFTSMGDPQ